VSPGARAAGLAAFLLSLALLLAACGSGSNGSSATEDGRLVIATSTSVIADIVRNVAPDADVWPVVPQGGDVHFYEASPGDIKRMSQSDLAIFIGANLEKFREDAVWRRTAREHNVPVLELASRLELIKVDIIIDHGDHVHDLREGDPHIWLDPAMVEGMVSLIASHLAEIDPARAAHYAENAATYRQKLVVLHDELTRDLARVPAHRRKLVVTHDSFAYFARRYGFEVIGFVTPADGSEPSAKHIAELHTKLRDAAVPAVFREATHGSKILESVALEANVKVGQVYSESVSRETPTYIDIMRFNVRSIVRHLGG
jgi:ABC-type Zn uptake system ZnuABC Zn-binding protein ZnuA